MGTRSLIGVMHGNVCKVVYCHWNGFLSHNGRILQEHYDSVKANNLVALGDISSLESEIGEKHDFDDHTCGTTKFYGRDRGEEGCEFKSLHNFNALVKYFNSSWVEYCYIMKDGVWYMFDNNNYTLRELAAELEKVAV